MRISNHCYAVTGLAYLPPWTVNAGFVVGDHTTLVVDSGANRLAAQTIYGYAMAVRPTNRVILVNTERHLDHLGGNGLFAEEGVPIYGHRDIMRQPGDLETLGREVNACIPNPARKVQGEGREFVANSTIVNPSVQLQADLALDLGHLGVLILLVPGHTPTNLAVWVPKDRTAFLGDCVVAGYLPTLEDGNPAQWQLWLESLDRIASLGPLRSLPGHGAVLDDSALFAEIAHHRQLLREAIRTGTAPTTPEAAPAVVG